MGAQRPAVLDGRVTTGIATWKTITLGLHADVDALRDALKAMGCGIGDLAGDALDQPEFPLRTTRADVDLVVLSVAELGFDADAPMAAICARAARLGLLLCPAEVGPQLRLQYPDQRVGEFLHIAMEPIVTDRGKRVGFIVGNGGARLLLIGSDARPDRILPAMVRLVFVRAEEVADLRR
jgi:hypothetical protein